MDKWCNRDKILLWHMHVGTLLSSCWTKPSSHYTNEFWSNSLFYHVLVSDYITSLLHSEECKYIARMCQVPIAVSIRFRRKSLWYGELVLYFSSLSFCCAKYLIRFLKNNFIRICLSFLNIFSHENTSVYSLSAF